MATTSFVGEVCRNNAEIALPMHALLVRLTARPARQPESARAARVREGRRRKVVMMKKQEKQLGISRFVPLVLISALGSLRAIPLLMSVSNTRSAGERLAALPSLCSLPRISASGERRLLYVHVGKTGGTTLDKVLRSNCEMYRLYGEHNTARKCLSALERGGGRRKLLE